MAARSRRRKTVFLRWLAVAAAAGLLALALSAERWAAALIEFEGGRRLSAVLRIGRLQFFSRGRITIEGFSLSSEGGAEPSLGWDTGVFRYDSIGSLRRGRLREVWLEGPWVNPDLLGFMRKPGSAGPEASLQDLVQRLPDRLSIENGRWERRGSRLEIRSLELGLRQIPTSSTLISVSARLLGEDLALGGEMIPPVLLEGEARVLGDSILVPQATVAVAGVETLRGSSEMSNWRSLPTLQARARTRDFSTTEILRRLAPQWLGRAGGVLEDGAFVWRGRPIPHSGESPFELRSTARVRDGFLRSSDGQAAVEGMDQDLALSAELDRDLMARRLRLEATGTVGAIRLPGRDFPGLRTGLALTVDPSGVGRRRLEAAGALTITNADRPVAGKSVFHLATRAQGAYDVVRGLLQGSLEECRLTVRPDQATSSQLTASGAFQVNWNDLDDPANLFQARIGGLGGDLVVRGTLPTGVSRSLEIAAPGVRLSTACQFLEALGLPAPLWADGRLSGLAQARMIPGEEGAVDVYASVAGFHPLGLGARRWGSLDFNVKGRARLSAGGERLSIENLEVDAGRTLTARLSGVVRLLSENKTASLSGRAAIPRFEQFSVFLGGLGFDLRGAAEVQGDMEAQAGPAGIQGKAQGSLGLRDIFLRYGVRRLVVANASAQVPATVAWTVDEPGGSRRCDLALDKAEGSIGYLEIDGRVFGQMPIALESGRIAVAAPRGSEAATLEIEGLKARAGQMLEVGVSGQVELGVEQWSPRLQASFKILDLARLSMPLGWPVEWRRGAKASGQAAIEPRRGGGLRATVDLNAQAPGFSLAGGAIFGQGLSVKGGQRIALELTEAGPALRASGFQVDCESILAGGARAASLTARFDAEGRSIVWTLDHMSLLGGVVWGTGKLAVRPEDGSAWSASAKLHFDGVDLEQAARTYNPPQTDLRGRVSGELSAAARDGRIESFDFSGKGQGGPVLINRERVMWMLTLGGTGYSPVLVERILKSGFQKADLVPFDTAAMEGSYVAPDAAAPESSDEFRATLQLENRSLKLTMPILLDRAALADYLRVQQEVALEGAGPQR